jgi:ApbE superfamily uncharacterized protein (UPF0280 family)
MKECTMKDDSYQPRAYRHWIEGKDLVAFKVTEKETDLYIRATSNLQRKALRLVLKYRRQLERYIEKNPVFQMSLEPVKVPQSASIIVREMAEAGEKAGVGPMAAVAGAIAEGVGKGLLEFSPEIIVENGGDIFLKILKKRVVGIYAGVCTSSGMVGHSLSYGKANAVIVAAASAALADAAATAICNRVKQPKDIDKALEFAWGIGGLRGVVVIIGNDIGVRGELKLCEISV